MRRAISQSVNGDENTNIGFKKRQTIDNEDRIGLKKHKDDMWVDNEKVEATEAKVEVT